MTGQETAPIALEEGLPGWEIHKGYDPLAKEQGPDELIKQEEPTDIVMLTCERIELFRKTLRYVRARTTSPYRLHVIDDGSGYTDYLEEVLRDGRIGNLISRPERKGIAANMRELAQISSSDPMVFTHDDVLPPKLDPDWLERGLMEMAARPKLGLLGLNSPHSNLGDRRHVIERGETVTLCQCLPGHFVFIRRQFLKERGTNWKAPPQNRRAPMKAMCRVAWELGYEVGYLTQVYCQHIGDISIRTGRDYSMELREVCPVDRQTLEPPEFYRG